ncbi:hypothetical protein PF672P1_00056 [Parabacteroides phage PF672P1]|nr:hypothetical protein PF672P1_00056 [Parabacteroides phage PF672P1]
MASKKAQELQIDINENAPVEFDVMGKKYRISHLCNWVSWKMAKYIIKADLLRTEDKEQMFVSFDQNRKLVPKCISLMILKSPVKVALFHWIHWRYLHVFMSQHEYNIILEKILNNTDIRFFFRNMALLQANNDLETEMTMESTKNITQKHVSRQSPI